MISHHPLLITATICSLLFLMHSLSRLRHHSSKSALQETKYTLVFRCITLRMCVYAYVFFVIAYALLVWLFVL